MLKKKKKKGFDLAASGRSEGLGGPTRTDRSLKSSQLRKDGNKSIVGKHTGEVYRTASLHAYSWSG